MIAERHHEPARRLLFEPDPPPDDKSAFGPWKGWQGRRHLAMRNHDDDEWGATVQEILIRYHVHGVLRKQLAAEYAMSERGIQTYLAGGGWPSYAQPVLRALRRLGLGRGRKNRERRAVAILGAAGRLAADVVLLLENDPRELAQQVVADLRLLATVRGAP